MHYGPHGYQKYATEGITELPIYALFMEAGLGKTVSTLTAIDELIYDRFKVGKVLVIASCRVADDTRTTEIEKWDYLKHLRASKVLGMSGERIVALEADADIYVINRENVTWLVNLTGEGWPFKMIMVDELSSFKFNSAKWSKSLRVARPPARRFVGLTGTPAPNGLSDLWSQVYLIGWGERLGKIYTGYKDRYFLPDRRNGFAVYPWTPKESVRGVIERKPSDICVSMRADDYLNLPAQIVNNVYVNTDRHEMRKYKEPEKEKLLELDGKEITALSATATWGKLLQLANGAAYNGEGNVIPLHGRKLDALAEVLGVPGGHLVPVFYNLRHDYDRLMGRFKGYNPRTLKSQQDIRDWSEGRIPLLLAQSASMGHGLNMQAGGHIIIWFGLNPSLELHLQANARLHRQGQAKAVIIHCLITKGMVDEDVVKKLWVKDETQDGLMESLKTRIRRIKDGNWIQHPKRENGDKLRDFLPGGQEATDM